MEIINDQFLKLNYTHHALKRKHERCNKFKPLPTILKITENNLQEVVTNEKEKLVKCKVKLEYSKNEDLYLIIHPFNDKRMASVITFWFDLKKQKIH